MFRNILKKQHSEANRGKLDLQTPLKQLRSSEGILWSVKQDHKEEKAVVLHN